MLSEPADDDRVGSNLRAAGRLLSSCGAIVVVYNNGSDSKGINHNNTLYTGGLPDDVYMLHEIDWLRSSRHE